jgi:hypothetical protein
VKRIVDYAPVSIEDAPPLPVHTPVEGSFKVIIDDEFTENDWLSTGEPLTVESTQTSGGYNMLFDDDADAGIHMFGDRYCQSMSRLPQTQQSLAPSLPQMPSLASLARTPRPQVLRDLPMKQPPPTIALSSMANGHSSDGNSIEHAEHQSAYSSPPTINIPAIAAALTPPAVLPTLPAGPASVTSMPAIPVDTLPPIIPPLTVPVPVVSVVPAVPNQPPAAVPTITVTTPGLDNLTESAQPITPIISATSILSPLCGNPFATTLDPDPETYVTDTEGGKVSAKSGNTGKRGGKGGRGRGRGKGRGNAPGRPQVDNKENSADTKNAGKGRKRKRADETEAVDQPPAKAIRRSVREIKVKRPFGDCD